jgi:hypothetical protein
VSLFEERGTERQEHRTARGTTRVWVLAPTVYVTVASGHMQEEHAEFLEAYGAERIRRSPGKLHVFHDWLEMTGYDSRCRQRLTSWSVARRDAYQEVHLALRSKLVAMGVQVANLALGGLMRVHTSRIGLEVELGRLLRASVLPPR